MHPELKKPSYSIPEVAAIIGVTRYRVHIMIQLGQLKAKLAGRQKIVMRENLQEYLSR